MGDFRSCLAFVMRREGGYAESPKIDQPTNMGITLPALSDWRREPCTRQDLKDLTSYEAGEIYKAKYWDMIKGDLLPQGIDLCCFDAAVNSGVHHSICWLQNCLGLSADGVIGPFTLKALQTCEVGETINKLINLRLAFLQSLPAWKNYGNGWSDRLADLRMEAL